MEEEGGRRWERNFTSPPLLYGFVLSPHTWCMWRLHTVLMLKTQRLNSPSLFTYLPTVLHPPTLDLKVQYQYSYYTT